MNSRLEESVKRNVRRVKNILKLMENKELTVEDFGGDEAAYTLYLQGKHPSFLPNSELEEVLLQAQKETHPLTMEQLEKFNPGQIFATGLSTNKSLCWPFRKEVRWVAVRGHGIPDWAIYFHDSSREEDYIKQSGNKLHDEKLIRRFVPCEDDAFEMYRF